MDNWRRAPQWPAATRRARAPIVQGSPPRLEHPLLFDSRVAARCSGDHHDFQDNFHPRDTTKNSLRHQRKLTPRRPKILRPAIDSGDAAELTPTLLPGVRVWGGLHCGRGPWRARGSLHARSSARTWALNARMWTTIHASGSDSDGGSDFGGMGRAGRTRPDQLATSFGRAVRSSASQQNGSSTTPQP